MARVSFSLRLGASTAVLCAMCLFSRWAGAQVNVEALRGDLRKTPAVASIEGSFAGRAGNTQGVVAGGAASGAARYGQHRFYGGSVVDYARFSGQTTVSKSFIHLRYNYVIVDWLAAELFAQQQQDKFQRLLLRELVGTGPRFVLADEDDLQVALGTAYMFEYERIAVAEGASDNPKVFANRWSNYVSAMVRPDDRVKANATLYLQPRIDDFSDVRVLVEASISTDITKKVGIRMTGSLRLDSQPPTGVLPTDVEVKNAIVIKF